MLQPLPLFNIKRKRKSFEPKGFSVDSIDFRRREILLLKRMNFCRYFFLGILFLLNFIPTISFFINPYLLVDLPIECSNKINEKENNYFRNVWVFVKIISFWWNFITFLRSLCLFSFLIKEMKKRHNYEFN